MAPGGFLSDCSGASQAAYGARLRAALGTQIGTAAQVTVRCTEQSQPQHQQREQQQPPREQQQRVIEVFSDEAEVGVHRRCKPHTVESGFALSGAWSPHCNVSLIGGRLLAVQRV